MASSSTGKKKLKFRHILIALVAFFAYMQITTEGEFGEDLLDSLIGDRPTVSLSDPTGVFPPPSGTGSNTETSSSQQGTVTFPPFNDTTTATTATQPDVDRLPSIPEALRNHVYLDARGTGSCARFTGDVVLYVVFVNDSKNNWTKDEVTQIQDQVNSTVSRITADAATYNTTLNLSVQYQTATASVALNRDNSLPWANNVLGSLGLPTDGTANLSLEKTFNCAEVPIIFFTNQGGRSFAINQHSNARIEYSVIYDDPAALYHEITHIFGSHDFYFPSEVQDLAEKHLPNSIMTHSETGSVDPFTAYLIGWTDTLSTDALTFVEKTAYLTDSYLKEQKEYDSYTGFVTNRETASGIYTGNLLDGMFHGQGKLVWDNGATYEGSWQFGKIHGNGTFLYEGGGKYIGPFKDGKRHGYGTYYYPDGDQYKGNWVDGEQSGEGTYTFADGSVYTGQFVNNSFHGNATFLYSDGSKYVGQFKNGKRHGRGTYYYSGGNQYEGDWVDGKQSGTGTFRWSDGTVYQGQWLDGQRHGQGTITYSYGNKYVGQFKNGELHGQGIYYYADGSIYDGQWVDGERTGQGKLTLANGSTYTGQFLNGPVHGEGTYIYADGGKYVGQFKNGKRHGRGTYYYPGGNQYEGDWIDGERTGNGTFRWSDGTIYQGQWLNGKRHGQGTITYPNGTVRTGTWNNNAFIG